MKSDAVAHPFGDLLRGQVQSDPGGGLHGFGVRDDGQGFHAVGGGDPRAVIHGLLAVSAADGDQAVDQVVGEGVVGPVGIAAVLAGPGDPGDGAAGDPVAVSAGRDLHLLAGELLLAARAIDHAVIAAGRLTAGGDIVLPDGFAGGVAQLRHDLLRDDHIPAERAVAALDQAGLGALRLHRVVRHDVLRRVFAELAVAFAAYVADGLMDTVGGAAHVVPGLREAADPAGVRVLLLVDLRPIAEIVRAESAADGAGAGGGVPAVVQLVACRAAALPVADVPVPGLVALPAVFVKVVTARGFDDPVTHVDLRHPVGVKVPPAVFAVPVGRVAVLQAGGGGGLRFLGGMVNDPVGSGYTIGVCDDRYGAGPGVCIL